MTIATTPAQSLGADLRSLRKARGLTLADMAERMDKSLGWMSQVERNLSEPTPDELKAFAAIYDVPVSLFFGQPNAAPAELGRIVRADARRALRTGVAGLVEELLSPDLTDDFEMFLSRFEPGAKWMNRIRGPHRNLAI